MIGQVYLREGHSPLTLDFPDMEDLQARAMMYGAVPTGPAPTTTLAELVDPYTARSLRDLGGLKVLARDEPLFRLGLTANMDEREWRSMEGSEPAISASIRALTATLLGYGFEIEVPDERKGMPAAIRVRDFTRSALKQLDGFETVLRQAVKSIYYGWMPMQAVWNTKARVKGRDAWVISTIAEQHSEHFCFTPERKLVYHGQGWIQHPRVLDSAGDRLSWLVFRAGSNRTPYGKAQLAYIWHLWWTLVHFQEWFERGARAAVQGVPVFRFASEGAGATGPMANKEVGRDQVLAATAQMASVQAALKFLQREGALVLFNGVVLDHFHKVDSVTGWHQAMDYLRNQIKVAIEGQVLTSEADSGNRSLGDVHQGTKTEVCKSIGRELSPLLGREILHRLASVNIPTIDPDDFPEFRFRIERRIDMASVRDFVDLGGEVDAEAVARDRNIPIPEGSAVKVLKRREGVPLGDTIFGGGEPPRANPAADPPEPREGRQPGEGGDPDGSMNPSRKPTAGRTLDDRQTGAAAKEIDEAAGRLEDAEGNRIGEAWRNYLSALTDAAVGAGDLDNPLPSGPVSK